MVMGRRTAGAIIFHLLYASIGLSEAEKRLTLCFANNDASERGVTRSMYDYAHYAEILLNVKSIIILPLLMNSSNPLSDGYDLTAPRESDRYSRKHARKFLPALVKRFRVSFCGRPFSDELQTELVAERRRENRHDMLTYYCEDLTRHCLTIGCDAVYMQKGGGVKHPPRYPEAFTASIPTIVHAVFNWNPHGSVYGAISESIKAYSRRYQGYIVPYVVTPPSNAPARGKSHRVRFNIPASALVVCRHGGNTTFSIPYARKSVWLALNRYNASELHFLFLGTQSMSFFLQKLVDKHCSTPTVGSSSIPPVACLRFSSQAHFLDTTVDDEDREVYFQTCDVMLHAREDGETFGLAVAEFSVRNKPVLTQRPVKRYSDAHVRVLGDQGLYYTNEGDILQHLDSLIKHGVPKDRNYTAFRQFYPELTMKIFKERFLDNIRPLIGRTDLQNATTLSG